jgi:predicted transcriptional regulator
VVAGRRGLPINGNFGIMQPNSIDLSYIEANGRAAQRRAALTDDTSITTPIELATELTIAWLGNPNTRASNDEVPAFLNRMYDAVRGLGNSPEQNAPAGSSVEHTPAVTARRSLSSPDHIISLIDGKPYKTLRRHLSTHGLTPQQYRERYNLKPEYPMVAPTYSEARRSMAKKIGLGQKGRASQGTSSNDAAKPKPAARRGRKPKGPSPE